MSLLAFILWYLLGTLGGLVVLAVIMLCLNKREFGKWWV
jgi:hypothetical protein